MKVRTGVRGWIRWSKYREAISLVLISVSSFSCFAQQNVFQLFSDGIKKADQYYDDGSYRHALKIYLEESVRTSTSNELSLKIARCHHQLHEYKSSAKSFSSFLQSGRSMDPSDRLMYAETLSAIGNYPAAIQQYNEYMKSAPEDELVQNKVWRLKNVHYLYEDSLHFSITKILVSTSFGELGAVPFTNGIVFLSNRSGVSAFETPDAETGENQFRLFFSPLVEDPATGLPNGFGKVQRFNKSLNAKWHNGPLCFYGGGTKVAFTKSSDAPNSKSKRTLQLYFAQWVGNTWRVTERFMHNNPEYNITEPWVSDDGMRLYFASDMKGGYGAKDIYTCQYKNGEWTSPKNVGPEINTRFDEGFPYVFKNHLYFSSNGHAGLGGLDVFKVPMLEDQFGEVTNAGYPLNSSADDFAICFRPDGNGAFLTSNRSQVSDDLYEVEIDLQSYPVVISGVLKSKDFAVSDSAIITPLPRTKMYLVDHSREIIVDEVLTDEEGRFELSIPYFSLYKIKVVESSGAHTLVSLQIPRQKKTDYTHEIVVVKDAFHTPE